MTKKFIFLLLSHIFSSFTKDLFKMKKWLLDSLSTDGCKTLIHPISALKNQFNPQNTTKYACG